MRLDIIIKNVILFNLKVFMVSQRNFFTWRIFVNWDDYSVQYWTRDVCMVHVVISGHSGCIAHRVQHFGKWSSKLESILPQHFFYSFFSTNRTIIISVTSTNKQNVWVINYLRSDQLMCRKTHLITYINSVFISKIFFIFKVFWSDV